MCSSHTSTHMILAKMNPGDWTFLQKKNLHKSYRLVVAVLKRVPWKGNIMNLDSKHLLCSAALGSLISHFHSFFLACMLSFVQVSHLENALSALDSAIKQLSPEFGFD